MKNRDIIKLFLPLFNHCAVLVVLKHQSTTKNNEKQLIFIFENYKKKGIIEMFGKKGNQLIINIGKSFYFGLCTFFKLSLYKYYL